LNRETLQSINPTILKEPNIVTNNSSYAPPKVWKLDTESGGTWSKINRPIAGPTHDKALPVGEHPLQGRRSAPAVKVREERDSGVGKNWREAEVGVRV